MDNEYEYIVVGSGAGGGPVAANLARAGHRVLLLEAGGTSESYNYQVPAFHPAASEEEAMAWEFYPRHYADDGQQRLDPKFCPEKNGVFYPRAGTLGGCTAHNAMILVYPSNDDWDHLAALTGDDSWNARNMRRYFERLERCRYRPVQKLLQWILRRNPSCHGFRGWLTTSKAGLDVVLRVLWDRQLRKILVKSTWAAFKVFRNRLAHLLRGLKARLDPNDWTLVKKNATGIRLTPLCTEGGRRVSTRELLLRVQEAYPENLTIRTGALVTRVLFDDGNRAVGVEYLEGEHLYRADPNYRPDGPYQVRQVQATREVILAGGAFNTPQLLQLSGIGPAEVLRRHEIPVRVDLPGVGANLQDRYEISVVHKLKEPFALLDGAIMRPPKPGEEPDRDFRRWLRGRGIYTTNGAVVSIIKKSAVCSAPPPDLYIFGLVTNFYGYFPGYSQVIQEAHQYFTWAILKGYTRNTAGRVVIRSNDPRDVPDINFHYFHEGSPGADQDLDAVVEGVEFVRQITEGYQDLVEEEVLPGKKFQTRDEIREYVRNRAWGHHACGTCKMGPPDDPWAVLDSRFRVYGTKNLRVVDASIFPRIPGLFIVSAVYMIAEKASDVILEDAGP